jgi:hypothetical protein
VSSTRKFETGYGCVPKVYLRLRFHWAAWHKLTDDYFLHDQWRIHGQGFSSKANTYLRIICQVVTWVCVSLLCE